MGGELTVASTPGRGTTFTLRLFLPALRESALPAAAARLLAPTGYRGARRRLLVVDNEETDRRLVTERLQPLGFTLLQAATGEEALALLTHEPVDAVFMDLAMPGIDGWQAIRALREMGLVHTPVAIVSANAFDKGLDNDLGIGRDDFLVKPVRREQLLAWLGARLALQWTEGPAAPPRRCPRRRRCRSSRRRRRWCCRRRPICTPCTRRCGWAGCAASCSGWTPSRPSIASAPASSPTCGRWRAASSSTR
jgi:CheY-like chemotaxis protein